MTLDLLLKDYGKTVDDIEKIYHGKDHWCRCGCGGNYFEHDNPEDARGFKRAVNDLNKNFDDIVRVDDIDGCNNWINIPVGDGCYNKCYCIYFKK